MKRAVLVALLLAGCGLAVAPPARGADDAGEAGRRRGQALATVKRLGGEVKTGDSLPGRPVVGVSLKCSSCTDGDLAKVAEGFPELRELDLEGDCKGVENNHLTDAGLKHLRGLRKLEKLNVSWHEKVTDAGLEHLRTLSGLKQVDLGFTQVTAKGVAGLRKVLPNAAINAP